jgi:hypothetical protein
MTRLCRSRSVSRASQDRFRAGTRDASCVVKSFEPLVFDRMRGAELARAAKQLSLAGRCLRRRFSSRLWPASGCGLPVTMTGVPQQTLQV